MLGVVWLVIETRRDEMFELNLNDKTVAIKAWFDAETNEWFASKSINGHIVLIVDGFETEAAARKAVA
jgi:hypothetical protein